MQEFYYGWCIFNGIIEDRKANLIYRFIFFSPIKQIPPKKRKKVIMTSEFRNRKGTKKNTRMKDWKGKKVILNEHKSQPPINIVQSNFSSEVFRE